MIFTDGKQSELKQQVSLTVYSHKNGSVSFVLVLCHGPINLRANLQTVPLHPLPIANKDGVGGCLEVT